MRYRLVGDAWSGSIYEFYGHVSLTDNNLCQSRVLLLQSFLSVCILGMCLVLVLRTRRVSKSVFAPSRVLPVLHLGSRVNFV